MSEYRYQLHCHTSPCSHCGRITPDALVKSLREAGFSGAVITNHFYNGNTGIDRSLPWKKFVAQYEKDFLECKRLAQPFGLDILFGVEEHIGNGQEILCYGLTPEMLYSHPELKNPDIELWYKTLSPLGVLVIQAHPFRLRNYISDVGVLPLEFIDGIEAFNFGNLPEENEKAFEFSNLHKGLILTSGADAHLPHVLSKAGIITDKRLESPRILYEVLKNGEYTLVEEIVPDTYF